MSKKEDDSNGADPSEPGRRRAALPARPKERGRSASLLDDGKLDLDADAPPLALPDSLELDTSELERDFDDVERPALAPSPPAASDEAPLGPHALVGSRAEGPAVFLAPSPQPLLEPFEPTRILHSHTG